MNIFDFMYEPITFDKNKPIKLFEAFSGIGTQSMALKYLGIKVEHIGISEIDKFAIQSYEAIHGKVKNYGGIGSFDKLPAGVDIATWSFPCQDISLAGKQKGMEDGTRSNYGYVFLDTVENMDYKDRPKVLLMENVKALLNKNFRDDWREIQLRLENMGYKNYADSLIATDYGVPQTRDRVFIVSVKGEYNYNFPKPIPLVKKLKDYLEDKVDEKYYLSDKQIAKIQNSSFMQEKSRIHNPNGTIGTLLAKDYKDPKCVDLSLIQVGQMYGTEKEPNPQAGRIYDPAGLSPTLDSMQGGNRMPKIILPEATKQGYALAQDGDGVYINRPHQKRGVVQKGMIQTIKTKGSDVGVVVKDNRNLKEKLCDELIEKGIVKGGEVVNHSYTNSAKKTNSRLEPEDFIETKDGIMPTLTTRPDTLGVVVKGGAIRNRPDVKGVNRPIRIRKLTPLEAWRLMGIKDEDFYKAKSSGMSDSQLYKQAGNAIVVDVLMAIFSQMIK